MRCGRTRQRTYLRGAIQAALLEFLDTGLVFDRVWLAASKQTLQRFVVLHLHGGPSRFRFAGLQPTKVAAKKGQTCTGQASGEVH